MGPIVGYTMTDKVENYCNHMTLVICMLNKGETTPTFGVGVNERRFTLIVVMSSYANMGRVY